MRFVRFCRSLALLSGPCVLAVVALPAFVEGCSDDKAVCKGICDLGVVGDVDAHPVDGTSDFHIDTGTSTDAMEENGDADADADADAEAGGPGSPPDLPRLA